MEEISMKGSTCHPPPQLPHPPQPPFDPSFPPQPQYFHLFLHNYPPMVFSMAGRHHHPLHLSRRVLDRVPFLAKMGRKVCLEIGRQTGTSY